MPHAVWRKVQIAKNSNRRDLATERGSESDLGPLWPAVRNNATPSPIPQLNITANYSHPEPPREYPRCTPDSIKGAHNQLYSAVTQTCERLGTHRHLKDSRNTSSRRQPEHNKATCASPVRLEEMQETLKSQAIQRRGLKVVLDVVVRR